MPFALAIIGIALLIAGVRNKQDDLFKLIRSDFTGPNNFIFWMISILAIGAVGYIPKLKSISTAFLALVIVVLFLKKGVGFFSQFQQAIGLTTVINPAIVAQGVPTNPDVPVTNAPLQSLTPLGGIQ